MSACTAGHAGESSRQGSRLTSGCSAGKAGGLFLLLEHGLGPEPKVQKWQHRLNWLQMLLAGGCHLDRDMRALVSARLLLAGDLDEVLALDDERLLDAARPVT